MARPYFLLQVMNARSSASVSGSIATLVERAFFAGRSGSVRECVSVPRRKATSIAPTSQVRCPSAGLAHCGHLDQQPLFWRRRLLNSGPQSFTECTAHLALPSDVAGAARPWIPGRLPEF